MSVRERLYEDGRRRWEVRWRDADGRRRGAVFDRKGDADSFDLDRRRERQLHRQGYAPTPRPPERVTVDEWLDRWFASPDRQLAPSTRKQRGQILDKWVRPQLGSEQLVALTRPRLVAWREQILAAGAGVVNANRAKSALSVALTDATERGLIPANPALGWRALREPPPNARALTIAEVEAIRAQLVDDADRAAVSLLAYGGLRPEELAGLRWGDVPTRRNRVTIRRAVVQGHVGPTKTRQERTVPLPEPTRADLLRLKRTTPGAYVFAQPNGRPWSLNPWRKKRWTPARLRAAVPPARVYDTRHTAATELLRDGLPLPDVHQRLGHASIVTTLRRYAHAMAEAQIDGRPTLPLAERIAQERVKAERKAAEPKRIDRLANALDQAQRRSA